MTRPPPASGDQVPSLPAPSPHKPTAALAQDMRAERAALLRDFIGEAHDDGAGARYRFKRIVACIKAAASTFGELQEVVASGQ
jgi:hypothetical protein